MLNTSKYSCSKYNNNYIYKVFLIQIYEPHRRKITQENASEYIFKRWKIKIKLVIEFEIMVEMKSKLIIRKL